MKRKPSTKQILTACYAAILVVWIARAFLLYAVDTRLEPHFIPVEQAELKNIEKKENGVFIATNTDPQIILPQVEKKVRRVTLILENENNLGEMDLYFTRSQQQNFSPTQRVWGALQEDGSYVYQLPTGNVSALRVDPGNRSGVVIKLKGIALNPEKEFLSYFKITLYTGMLLLFIPALASCIICTIIEIACKIKQTAANAENKRIEYYE